VAGALRAGGASLLGLGLLGGLFLSRHAGFPVQIRQLSSENAQVLFEPEELLYSALGFLVDYS
jgi:hypothetical protein